MVWRPRTRLTRRKRASPRKEETVLESNGRPADELISLVRSYGRDLPDTERSTVTADTWRQIQRCLATSNAEMVLSAA